jgi:hypothetical protein
LVFECKVRVIRPRDGTHGREGVAVWVSARGAWWVTLAGEPPARGFFGDQEVERLTPAPPACDLASLIQTSGWVPIPEGPSEF